MPDAPDSDDPRAAPGTSSSGAAGAESATVPPETLRAALGAFLAATRALTAAADSAPADELEILVAERDRALERLQALFPALQLDAEPGSLPFARQLAEAMAAAHAEGQVAERAMRDRLEALGRQVSDLRRGEDALSAYRRALGLPARPRSAAAHSSDAHDGGEGPSVHGSDRRDGRGST